MAQPPATPTIVRKTVVIFDICSSTSILEDLVRTENQIRWQSLLGQLKRFLWSEGGNRTFLMYKFMGDGWILLFDEVPFSGRQLISLMNRLCAEYDRLFYEHVVEVLTGMPKVIGVTFGIDEGSLVQIVMNRQTEYVGRALNVATRLQSAIKQLAGPPGGSLLISNNAFARLGLHVDHEEVVCNLANVTGGERYRARKVMMDAVRILAAPYRERPTA